MQQSAVPLFRQPSTTAQKQAKNSDPLSPAQAKTIHADAKKAFSENKNYALSQQVDLSKSSNLANVPC